MANECSGFHKVGFVKKDLYNQVGKQRKQLYFDVSDAVKYLKDLSLKDPLMFVTHTLDKDKRLERLFWSDGESQMNYEIFGDVIAFDVTYRKNKYNCPFVIFSSVNHHNHMIVFGAGIVTRETKETYVWLLEQFLSAMKGKHLLSVITDGDLAMRNAIKKNASSNIEIPVVMSYLKKCMLGDLEISAFEELWVEMVEKFGLQDNSWINEMCLTYFRFRKIESDFHSNYGQLVLQTGLQSIERSAAKLFTKEIFFMFRSVLKKALLIRITECQEMATSGSLYWDSQSAARYSGIVKMCKVVAGLVYEDLDEYQHFVESLGAELRRLKIKNKVDTT
ncbi:protein FAR1-RELATED SEQUENCE 5-like [Medicago truncatula]|uniref:protein FAR1-RELATED SEQUENCE 5-like n=1 Tax=Medicago truncatula TaxID=3880 RepID=UPI000D2F14C5|nr:protein FAR1-RELATED SEQUENCE 5-like [Medicago truncatula]